MPPLIKPIKMFHKEVQKKNKLEFIHLIEAPKTFMVNYTNFSYIIIKRKKELRKSNKNFRTFNKATLFIYWKWSRVKIGSLFDVRHA